MQRKNDVIIKELELKFSNYNNYEKLIQKQILAQKIEHEEEDENIGGGRSSIISNPTESQGTFQANDLFIQECRKYQRAIERTLDELKEDERKLIEERYWGGCSWMTWKEFADTKHYSTSSMSRLKQKVLLNFGRKIGRLGSWE